MAGLNVEVNVKDTEFVRGLVECLLLAMSMLEGEQKEMVQAKMQELGLVDIS